MDKQTAGANRDVIILGGGLAGLTLALQIRQELPQATISVLEKNAHPVPEAAFKVGESTVEIGAHYFAKVLGQEAHIHDQQLPKLGLRYFFGGGDNLAIERRLEFGSSQFAPTPSYQLDRGRFENHLGEQCRAADIDFVDDARIKEVQLGRGRAAHVVQYDRDEQTHVLKGRWIADASGRAGLLKRQLGLAKPSPHMANAAWFRIGELIKIDDWARDRSWSDGYPSTTARWYSTNHLMGAGYWVWIIPLASGSTSIGIVADEAIHPLSSFNSMQKALDWLERHEPQCADQVRRHEDKLQDFLAIKQYSVECEQILSSRRWGITGEAGFFLDPFYSPGSDFIALGNTLLSDLIRRELSGQSIRLRATMYDRIFKAFYHGTAAIFQDQYQLFGNHQVMPVKIVWDWMLYWSLTGLVYFQDRICNLAMYPRHMFKLRKLSRLNHFMQDFFRRWHQEQPGREVHGSIDVFDMDMIPNMNGRLTDQLDNRAFNRRFAHNVAQLETLMWEIVDHAGLNVQVPFKRREHSHTRHNAIKEVFKITTRPKDVGCVET